MDTVLGHYDSLKAAINNEDYEEAGQYMVQLDQCLRKLFATPPSLSDTEQMKLNEISEFLAKSCDKMIAKRADTAAELGNFSTAKKMKKAYGKF